MHGWTLSVLRQSSRFAGLSGRSVNWQREFCEDVSSGACAEMQQVSFASSRGTTGAPLKAVEAVERHPTTAGEG